MLCNSQSLSLQGLHGMLQCILQYAVVCWSALQCVLQYIVVCCRVLQGVAWSYSVLQCHSTCNCPRPSLQSAAVCCSVCCSVLQCAEAYVAVYDAVCRGMLQGVAVCRSMLQRVPVSPHPQFPASLVAGRAACYSVCYSVCCSMLQCVAVSVHLQLPEPFVAVSCSVCCSVRYSLCCSVCC